MDILSVAKELGPKADGGVRVFLCRMDDAIDLDHRNGDRGCGCHGQEDHCPNGNGADRVVSRQDPVLPRLSTLFP